MTGNLHLTTLPLLVDLITWRSKKQKVVTRSSAEGEYRGMAHGVNELLWLQNLLLDLGFKPKR